MTLIADPHLRRGAGSLLVVAGTAAALFALTAPGGSSAGASRTVDLGAGVRAVSVDLPSARLRLVGGAGDGASLRIAGDARIVHAGGATARIRCAPGADCAGAALELRVPRGADVDVRLGAGRASVSGIAGAIVLRSTSAALSALDVRPRSLRATTESGAIQVSASRVASVVEAESTTGPISISVPYAYASDGYAVSADTRGHRDLDITASAARGAPAVRARSRTGDILITQRYPNMS